MYKHFSKAAIVLIMALVFMPHSATPSYSYPIEDPIGATFTFTLLKGQYRGWKQLVSVRDDVGPRPITYSGDEKYPINCFFHRKGKRPLVFLLTGIGSSAYNSASRYIASRLYRTGYHVVVLPSTFTDTFIHTASEEVFTGQVRVDAIDQYKALKAVKKHIEWLQIPVTDYRLFGYSLGAAVGAFVSELDKGPDALNISKYLILNPPIDIMHGLETVDRFAETKIESKWRKLIRVGLRIFNFRMRNRAPEEAETRFLSRLNVNQNDMKHFIGLSLRDSLDDVVFMTQRRINLGVLGKGTAWAKKRRARRYDFVSYVKGIVAKFYQQTELGKKKWREHYQTAHYSLPRLQYRNSLYSLRDTFTNDERVHLIHNTDDFLLRNEDIAYLEDTLGDRFYLYPRGGHLGNVWYEENFDLYKEILAQPALQ